MKKGRVDSESGVCCDGEVSVGAWVVTPEERNIKNWCCEVFNILLILIEFG